MPVLQDNTRGRAGKDARFFLHSWRTLNVIRSERMRKWWLAALAAGALQAAVVRGVLRDADWKTWASVNDYLPIFAEAAPEEFLAAVEAALDADPSPFVEVFAQERAGILTCQVRVHWIRAIDDK